MQYAVCCVPVSPLRLEPSHKSEMVSQQLFGESCVITGTVQNWIKVTCRYDQYEGWCQPGHVTDIDEPFYSADITLLTQEWINEIHYHGRSMMVPMGCVLSGLSNGFASWGVNGIGYNGKAWKISDAGRDEDTITQLAFSFLNTPYLWGGKSIFGIDCSGFVQTVFKFLGVYLNRDAYQQATQGEMVGFLQEARCGDLAFFDNEEGRIIHVGMLLNDHEIIHASVKVRIDSIDNHGIINTDTFERTHRLRIIKRVI